MVLYIIILPFSSILLLISSLSLSSLPFFSGFYSKELIILSTIIYKNPILYIFLSFGALLTFFYSIRLFYFSFFSFPNFNSFSFYSSTYIIPSSFNFQPNPAPQGWVERLKIKV